LLFHSNAARPICQHHDRHCRYRHPRYRRSIARPAEIP
jgi:hypothetical protein